MLPHTLQENNPKQQQKDVYTEPPTMYDTYMTEIELYEQMEQELLVFATKYSLTRAKLSTPNFDRDYKRGQDGSFNLVSTKAVVRSLGKVTKVPIGENEACQTYEQAAEAAKKHWSEYYKRIRASRSPEQLRRDAQRQKRYRERRKSEVTEFKRQQ